MNLLRHALSLPRGGAWMKGAAACRGLLPVVDTLDTARPPAGHALAQHRLYGKPSKQLIFECSPVTNFQLAEPTRPTSAAEHSAQSLTLLLRLLSPGGRHTQRRRQR